MATQRAVSYARAYRFGTDGSAALAQEPVYTREAAPVRRDTIRREGRARPTPQKKQTAFMVPKWALILVVAACIFAAAMSLLGGKSELSAMSKQISSMRLELAQIQQVNEGLEVQIEAAADPQRIRTLALNRLGMSMPSEDRVFRVTAPAVSRSQTVSMPAQQEQESLLDLLISSLTHP